MTTMNKSRRGDAVDLGAANTFVDRKVGCYLPKALLGINCDHGVVVMDNGWSSIRFKIAAADGVKILADAHTAMGVMAHEVTADQGGCHQLCDIFRRACRRKNALDKVNHASGLK